MSIQFLLLKAHSFVRIKKINGYLLLSTLGFLSEGIWKQTCDSLLSRRLLFLLFRRFKMRKISWFVLSLWLYLFTRIFLFSALLAVTILICILNWNPWFIKIFIVRDLAEKYCLNRWHFNSFTLLCNLFWGLIEKWLSNMNVFITILYQVALKISE